MPLFLSPKRTLCELGFFDPNQISRLNLNTSAPKWTASENIGSLESKNGSHCCIALDRFVEKSPEFIGI